MTAYEKVINDNNTFIYGALKTAVDKHLNAKTTPSALLGLPASAPSPTQTSVLNGLKGSSTGDDAIAIDLATATTVFKNIAKEIQGQREILTLGFNGLRAAKVSEAEMKPLRDSRKTLNTGMDNFWTSAKPHRYYYKVYSRPPMTAGTYAGIKSAMLAKAQSTEVGAAV